MTLVEEARLLLAFCTWHRRWHKGIHKTALTGASPLSVLRMLRWDTHRLYNGVFLKAYPNEAPFFVEYGAFEALYVTWLSEKG